MSHESVMDALSSARSLLRFYRKAKLPRVLWRGKRCRESLISEMAEVVADLRHLASRNRILWKEVDHLSTVKMENDKNDDSDRHRAR